MGCPVGSTKPTVPKTHKGDYMKKKKTDDTYNIISRHHFHPEESAVLKMIICRDFYMDKIRRSIGDNSKLTYEKVNEFFERNNNIMAELNRLNADMAQILGDKYTPPRGYKD
jgi:hypothetical protein